MKKKKSFFLWLLLLVFLTTYNFESIENRDSSFLPVKIIKIEGTINSDREKIQKSLTQFKGKNLIFVSRKQLRETTKDLIFVKELHIKKIYPDTIKIIIIEYKPLGIFFDKNEKFLLAEGGKIIENYETKKFEYLPVVEGKNAEKNFHIFYRSIADMNFQIELVEKFNYFDINRWDIILKNGKVIKLPNKNYKHLLKEFLSIYKKENFKDFKVFDFRVKGQLILK
tara:strand:- start:555 stop:1229 length:675 start_codon:yes stop_codon:yes gene_type:complete